MAEPGTLGKATTFPWMDPHSDIQTRLPANHDDLVHIEQQLLVQQLPEGEAAF